MPKAGAVCGLIGGDGGATEAPGAVCAQAAAAVKSTVPDSKANVQHRFIFLLPLAPFIYFRVMPSNPAGSAGSGVGPDGNPFFDNM